MKPFDLAACIRGEAVVTRGGMPYVFGSFNQNPNVDYPITGSVNGRAMTHMADGRFDIDFESHLDLFMLTEKQAERTEWVLRVGYPGKIIDFHGPYSSKEVALYHAEGFSGERSVHPITVTD